MTITTSAMVSISVNWTSATGGPDGERPVGGDRYLDRGRNRGLQRRQQGFDAVHGLDDVGVGNALNGQDDGRTPCHTIPEANRSRDLRSPCRCRGSGTGEPLRSCDDQLVIGGGIQQLIVGVQRVGHPPGC